MFANILLQQKVGTQGMLTYRLRSDLKVRRGNFVEIPLRNRQTRGVIMNIHEHEPPYQTKEILTLVENAPHLFAWQVELLEWLSDYYFCPLYKVLKLFLPKPFFSKKKLTPVINEEGVSEFKAEHTLNTDQQKIIESLLKSTAKRFLIHGITGSGKTEIYIHYTHHFLKQGKQILILVPEISLTPQVVHRFEKHFQQKITVIHSQLTAKEKEQAWMSIQKGESRIIIGSRSALFAPFQNLGCIIMDEEHDSSYKQDQSPRYHTLTVAEKISELLDIPLVVGSATPSLETYYKAITGHYQLLELTARAHIAGNEAVQLPKITIVDLRQEIKKKNFSIFSQPLKEKIAALLAKNEQTLLFLNRRGAATSVICRECGYVAKCKRCDISLTYHKKFTAENTVFHTEKLICHHCGKIEVVPHVCPYCSSAYIRYLGLGTQRVEDEISKLFSLARVIRIDRDTTQKRGNFKAMYHQIKNHEVDIVIGTQMISMGLDLPKVNLVGVVLADLGLTIPDFRSSEKVFQLLTQVAGRAGRKSSEGEVIIQTYLPHHYAITRASKHDYKGFYEEEIKIRKQLDYPPFSKLIKLTIRHKSNKLAEEKIHTLFKELENLDKKKECEMTYYPALIPKLKNLYRWHILVKGQQPEKILKQSQLLENVIIDVDTISTV